MVKHPVTLSSYSILLTSNRLKFLSMVIFDDVARGTAFTMLASSADISRESREQMEDVVIAGISRLLEVFTIDFSCSSSRLRVFILGLGVSSWLSIFFILD